ncbi:MAG: helix-turn-helix transcriptional regulator [bacterium]|nr:helix-turn-helix transcriptional regulator [bacterium]
MYKFKKIGERIAKARGDREMRQIEFAEILNISRSNLSRIENGAVRPTLDILLILKNKLGISIDWMLTGKGDSAGMAPIEYDSEVRELLEFMKRNRAMKYHILGAFHSYKELLENLQAGVNLETELDHVGRN